MGVDSSIILKCDYKETGDQEERTAYIHKMEETLLRKYAIKDKTKGISDEYDNTFNFEPYDVVGINLYNGFWEIETAFTYHQYTSGSIRALFSDMVQDFGLEEAYVCSEHCTWNGEDMDNHTFESWVAKMEERFGPIQKYNPATTPTASDVPEVFLDDFSDYKEEKDRIKNIADGLGMEVTGITGIGVGLLFFRKGDDLYCYDDENQRFFVDSPIDGYENFNCLGYALSQKGVDTVYAITGEVLMRGNAGSFIWRYSDRVKDKTSTWICEIVNTENDEFVIIRDRHEWDNENNCGRCYRTYEDCRGNVIIPEFQL